MYGKAPSMDKTIQSNQLSCAHPQEFTVELNPLVWFSLQFDKVKAYKALTPIFAIMDNIAILMNYRAFIDFLGWWRGKDQSE